MNDYESYKSLVEKMDRIKNEISLLDAQLDYLKATHKHHVFKFLSDSADQLSRVNMHLLRGPLDGNDFSSALYQVQVLDERPVLQYDFDAYCPDAFSQFKLHFEKSIKPYIATKRKMLKLEARLKPKTETKKRLKI